MPPVFGTGQGPLQVFTLTATDPLFLTDTGAFWNKAATLDFSLRTSSLCTITFSMVVEVPKPSEVVPAPSPPGFLQSVEGICRLDPVGPQFVDGGTDASPAGAIRFGDNHALTMTSPLRYKRATTFTWVLPCVTRGQHKLTILLRYNIDLPVSPPPTTFQNPSSKERTLVIYALPAVRPAGRKISAETPSRARRKRG